ncbi:MAG: M23 family metallopeptidase [candidate division NC10 bacterium]|nr:M23 family metallopeptidase [candidate division NC10 bacterium]
MGQPRPRGIGAGDHLPGAELSRAEDPAGREAVDPGLDSDDLAGQGFGDGRVRLPAVTFHGTAGNARGAGCRRPPWESHPGHGRWGRLLLGSVVFINHGHGFTTFYAHNSSNRVKEGQQVRRGEVVAYVGTSGRTTGPHVHYEVQVNGTTVNPLKYIVDPSGAKFANEGESGGQS